MKFRLPMAAAVAAILAMPSAAGAAQTATLHYDCKYPLIGVKKLDVKIELGIPESWPASQPTDAFTVVATASAYDMAAGLAAVDGLTSIDGTSTAFATVHTAQGFDVPAKTVATIANTILPDPIPDPLVLTAIGSTPALTFDDQGAKTITLDRLAINLTARDAAGDPIQLPPVSKDIDGRFQFDSDRNPDTFDVYCKLSPADQDTTIGSFQIEPPGPTPTGTPTPPPSPTPVGTPTPAPSPTPVGTPTPTPSPSPTPTAVPPIPPTAIAEPYQCKWPLIGTKQAEFFAVTTASQGDLLIDVWMRVDEAGEGLSLIDDLDHLGGTMTVELTGGGPSLNARLTTAVVVDASSIQDPSTGDPTLIHATRRVPADIFPVGTSVVRVTKAAPNLIAVDTAGDPIVLPPLTRDVAGQPTSDSDGNPNTFDVSCAGSGNVPTPTPGPPTPEPTATPTPPPPTPTPAPRPVPEPVALGSHTAELDYQCKLPLIGVKPAHLQVTTDLPTAITGPVIPRWPISASLTLADLAQGLGGPDLNGTWQAALGIFSTDFGPSARGSAIAQINTPEVAFPPAPGSGEITFAGDSLFFTNDVGAGGKGIHTFTLDRFAVNITARDLNGDVVLYPPVKRDIDGNPVNDSDGNPDTFDLYCKLSPEGQDDRLGSTDYWGPTTPTPTPPPTATPLPMTSPTLMPPPTPTPSPTPMPTVPATVSPRPTPTPTPPPTLARFSYALSGSTSINTLTKGSMPLTGSIDAELDVSTGAYTAQTVINDTQGRLTALGFLPVTVGVGIIPSGATTGQLVDDQLTANLKARIKVKSVKAFGAIPLAGGNSCQSRQLSDISLKSTDPFDPTNTGGTIAGSYKISDLNGCGVLNGLVSPLTAGAGNTITVKLTPKP